ncbi:hypothetical protein HN695_04005 [Candidatus Woesearchaeota archaeon]|jgi:hypothetical protein|nr:hypothetical protein [Candidatus Woesearchaeota archaeon]MBT5272312.1 hypothetical protein [Candidatus Woesearchaeota archaeon]MBT6040641.1 hypothetical protein [Candidatus Woesearchaeota archaeon]MBT6336584.1 hypothetical protein [Candidatus Woesearchaeota archaeon]MBT7927474.1 hypothetical protein [Candidatus Woesearchaeota archaeon]
MGKPKHKNHKKNSLIGIVIILILIAGFFGVNFFLAKKVVSDLSEELTTFKYETEIEINELTAQISEADTEKTLLNENLGELETEHQELEGSYKELEEKQKELADATKKTLQKVKSYETEMQESMSWFKSNSIINDELPRAKDIKYYLRENNCYKMGTQTCHIKTGCFFFINAERLGIHYLYDQVTSGAVDKLQPIDTFIDNKGGDCEDYSLFYKAEFNYVLNQCLEEGADNIILEGWGASDDPEEWYWVEFSKTWYIAGGTDKYLPEGYIYPNIVCGNMYDFVNNVYQGHCIIAFTKNKIKSVADMDELDMAPMIEPQNGLYMGRINDGQGIYLINKDNFGKVPSIIYEVITDEDLYLYSQDYQEWLSYSLFSEELAEQKKAMIELLN